MKKKQLYQVLVIVVALLILSVTGGIAASVPSKINPWNPGTAESECAQIGSYEYACKIDWDSVEENGIHVCSFDDGHTNNITIQNSNGTYFDWSASPNPIGAAIVKGGRYANMFAYLPQAFSDAQLFSPVNPSGKPAAVGYTTFCWNPEESSCYSYETAWAAGTRYVSKGNLATYTPYTGRAQMVNLVAGQYYVAGTVTFSAPVEGMVTITIQLNPGWYFAYGEEVGGLFDESLHIQGYNNEPATENPSPGLFTYNFNAEGQDFSIQVPAATFAYGVHASLAMEVSCQ
jgi:hypothetical protein